MTSSSSSTLVIKKHCDMSLYNGVFNIKLSEYLFIQPQTVSDILDHPVLQLLACYNIGERAVHTSNNSNHVIEYCATVYERNGKKYFGLSKLQVEFLIN